MIILGVTGSIGSGKSQFCRTLAMQKGVRVLSSDEEVHDLYESDKELVRQISKHFSKAVVAGKIDRKILGELVFKDADKKKQLENIVYPLLAKRREQFLKKAIKDKIKLVVFEIPLLFENGLDQFCDYTVTLYCSPIIQRARVLARNKDMSVEKYESIVRTQMPVAEKIKYSDYHFNTGRGKEFTTRAAKNLYLKLV